MSDDVLEDNLLDPALACAFVARKKASRLARILFAGLVSLAAHASAQTSYTCLPKNLHADDIISYAYDGTAAARPHTLGQELDAHKARCEKGKLRDERGREIHFYRSELSGGRPSQRTLDIRDRENRELSRLRKRFTVIVLPSKVSSHPVP